MSVFAFVFLFITSMADRRARVSILIVARAGSTLGNPNRRVRTQVERPEAENERLHAERDELRETTEVGTKTDADTTTPSTATRFWQWVTGDGTES